ncbi:ATP-dependent helicase fft2 [Echria macrotheca]|uniref:ATP-dependent helicase fft2 n=1 Tax=Echria macrotheca TaxID=438768 RepID=A0AAJ0F3K9_9PEZI|nr:ATP-dependent helicase fft2 [Echria macrotheca]
MEFSSPRPRHIRSSIPESPNAGFSDSILDSEDELNTLSTSHYFAGTQPTQILERPALQQQPKISSSPSSTVDVEVPASSPFKNHSALRNAKSLGSVIAPRGTTFRNPAAKPAPLKKAINISDDELNTPTYIVVDDSDDETPARGDIRPASFEQKNSKAVVNLGKEKPRASKSVWKMSDQGSPITSPAAGYTPMKDWVMSDSSPSPEKASVNSSPDKLASSPPVQPRRRLVQGRRPRHSSPASSPLKVSQTVPEPIIQRPAKRPISIYDSDSDDEYKREPGAQNRSTSPEAPSEEMAFNDRVLKYLNTCDTIQLVAIAGVKEESARLMLRHQPFADIDAAMNVTINQKKQRKKSSRVAIGEDIVSSVKSYIRALDGIDHVIAVCESQADEIKRTTSRWLLDQTGQPRDDNKGDDEKPMTPNSIAESPKLIKLPLGQPKMMDSHCTMKSFQIYGLNWLFMLYEKQYGAILADDMGLGKTCQVISLICSVVEDFERNGKERAAQPWPNLIMVPPSTLANWGAEFERFAPDLNVTVYQGSQAVRDEIADEILDDPSQHHVVLTSYTQVSRPEDIANLRGMRPRIAVFDEGHKMKNPKTKLYKDLIRITASWRLILSGTPVQNNLMEMVSLLQFIEPDLFRNHFDDLEALFNQKVSLTAVSQGALLYSERVARARSILEPFILQRRKEQVLKDMPSKTTRVELCEMDETQATIYKEYERRFKRTDQTAAAKTGRDNDNNNVWMQLRKSAIHPQLFRRFYTDEKVEKMAKILMKKVPQSELRQPNIVHLTDELKALSDFEIHLWCRDYKCIREYDLPAGSWVENAKVKTLLNLIKGYQANGDRALVFTRYAKVIELLGEALAFSGVKHLSLQGNTDVSERQELINQFNSDDTIPVFLLTTGSGGTGINLTAANKVIIFDQSDNPQDDIQAENRAHRLGQTRPVEVIRLISKNTIEELVYKACQKKLELANKVTGWAVVEMTSGQMEAAVREELINGSSLATPPSD